MSCFQKQQSAPTRKTLAFNTCMMQLYAVSHFIQVRSAEKTFPHRTKVTVHIQGLADGTDRVPKALTSKGNLSLFKLSLGRQGLDAKSGWHCWDQLSLRWSVSSLSWKGCPPAFVLLDQAQYQSRFHLSTSALGLTHLMPVTLTGEYSNDRPQYEPR